MSYADNAMKRDFELIRKLLVYFDEKPDAAVVELPDIGTGYSGSEIKYHLLLLYEAGFLDCELIRSTTSDRVVKVLPFNPTWDGHEFLAKIRNDSVWQKIQTAIASKGGTLAFAVINQLATKFALHASGL
jgi:hypothetical protein